MDWVKSLLEDAKTASEAVSAAAHLVDAHRGVGEKMQILKRKSDVLASMMSDKEMELAHAESLGKRRKAEAETWLKQVEWIGADVQQINQQVAEAGMISRLELACRVDERTREVEQLIEQGEFPTGLTLDVEKMESVVELPTCELVGRAFESNKRKILECLRDDSISTIGIHGMGGVGKTTLATHVYKQLQKDGEIVHWITVSQECSIHKLQSDLAACLFVDLSPVKNDLKERAAKLWDALEEKIAVIILDDMWRRYSLEEVGIPVGIDSCKLILTSRSLDLCREMGCQKLIYMQRLPDEEAWQLFRKNLNRRVPFTYKVEGIARSVANECSGLPLAIILLSASMRGVQDIFEWRYVLEELRELRSTECMENEVFRVLRFSYDRLTHETARHCFVHFALYPEDYEMDRKSLVQHFMDAGLLSSRSGREAASNRGYAVINKLLRVRLLECGKNSQNDCVKMHNLVRDMVISMHKTRFLVLAKLRIREIQLEDWTEGLEKISLMHNVVSEIPSGASPRCPELTVLLLNDNSDLRSIPDDFFKHMPSLQFIDLSRTSIETLPSSIKDLDKLATLNLLWCRVLHDLPPLPSSLVSLNLMGSGLEKCPILSRFSHLKLLDMLKTKVRTKASDLKSLRKLEKMGCTFGEVWEFNAYAEYLNEIDGCVQSYVLHLTGGPVHHLPEPGRRMAVLDGCRVDGNVLLPRGTKELAVHDLDSPRRSLSDLASLPLTNFKDLKECRIEDWKSMKCFISLDSSSASIPHGNNGTILPGLEDLHLRSLPELRLVVETSGDGGHLDKSSYDSGWSSDSGTSQHPTRGAIATTVSIFPRLTRLIVVGCPRIRKLLTAALLPSLVNLEQMGIMDCEGMTEIVSSEAAAGAGAGEGVMVTRTTLPFLLPKLRLLFLIDLPRLRSICGNGTMMLGGSIETVSVKGCHMLQRIPLHLQEIDGRVSVPPLLHRIIIDDSDLSWWESLAWDHNTAKEVIRPFLQVDVDTRKSYSSSSSSNG